MQQVWSGIPIFLEEDCNVDKITVQLPSGEYSHVSPNLESFPNHISGMAMHVGVCDKPDVLDFSVVRMPKPCIASAVYTRSLCVSPAIIYDRENTKRGLIQLLCVISKNASVFTPTAPEDIERITDALSKEFNVDKREILISCTGVIGRPLPVERIIENMSGCSSMLSEDGVDAVSEAILTTDKRPKQASIRIGDLVIGGYAKGAGMIEPNMATLLVYLYTNADISKTKLDLALKKSADLTFNSLSVDSDTSTSDTMALLATGEVSVEDEAVFQSALSAVCLHLARAVAREAEGATKLLEVRVSLSTSEEDARFFAKKIINSPLIKTAVHGGDPNWGRVVMAIGKPTPGSPLLTINPKELLISIQDRLLFDRGQRVDADLNALSHDIKLSTNVVIDVRIGNPLYTATVWGCDLSAEYVDENAHYTS